MGKHIPITHWFSMVTAMEEYLTVIELSKKIKFSKQSLYNLIHKGTFILGRHYLKPTPKKVLFKWSEIRAWIGDDFHSDKKPSQESEDSTTVSGHSDNPSPSRPISLINI